MDYRHRLETLQEKLRRSNLDALLISQPDNRRYLSGYTAADHGIGESSGVLYVPARGGVQLFTDFRFRTQAEQETTLPVTCYTKGLLPLLDTIISDTSITRLGFESHYTLHSFSVKLAEIAARNNCEIIPAHTFVERMRLIKSAEEIERIRQSVILNETVFRQVHQDLTAEMSEIDVALALETAMRRGGEEKPSFPSIVAAGINSALPHAVPTEQPIGKNQPVTIDMGLILSGYCSDMTRSFVLGKADQHYTKIHRLVRVAQKAGIAAVRQGVSMKEVDHCARQVIAGGGYAKQFGHSLGHGVGLAVHEGPRVSSRSRQKLKEGMVITIEPGIYIPGWGGVRLENMVVVTPDGCEVLNHDTTWLDI